MSNCTDEHSVQLKKKHHKRKIDGVNSSETVNEAVTTTTNHKRKIADSQAHDDAAAKISKTQCTSEERPSVQIKNAVFSNGNTTESKIQTQHHHKPHTQQKNNIPRSQSGGTEAATGKVEKGNRGQGQWNFAVDYNDHFETPRIAYSDIAPMLNALAESLHKSPSELVIYDPYWCQGCMVAHLAALGFPNVINNNRDFYVDIKNKRIPGKQRSSCVLWFYLLLFHLKCRAVLVVFSLSIMTSALIAFYFFNAEYDILVTNPPYSGEHKVNLLKFLSTHRSATAGANSKLSSECPTSAQTSNSTSKPFALLLPVYVATKSYWKDFASQQMQTSGSGTSSGSGNSSGTKVFYILPPDYYEYSHPEGTGKDIPPFYSAWFVGGFSNPERNRYLVRWKECSIFLLH